MALRGRPRTSTTLMVEECVELSVFDLEVPFAPYGPASPATVTTAWHDGKKINQTLTTTSTRPYYGGARYWFLCPECEGRYGKLYAHEGHRQYACRECLGLAYESQYLKGPHAQARQLLRWHRSSARSKRRWGQQIEQALVEGSMDWGQAWGEINSP